LLTSCHIADMPSILQTGKYKKRRSSYYFSWILRTGIQKSRRTSQTNLKSPNLWDLPSRIFISQMSFLMPSQQHQYKIAVTVFKILTTQQPSYLANNIRFRAASRQLRSCGRNLLHDDRTNLAFANRAFSHAAPAVWNSLPLDIVSDLSCLATFKRLVKTELYNRAYLRWFVTSRTYDSSLCEWL